MSTLLRNGAHRRLSIPNPAIPNPGARRPVPPRPPAHPPAPTPAPGATVVHPPVAAPYEVAAPTRHAPLAGRTLRVLDDRVTVLLAQEDTRGQLALLLLDALPGSGVPAHCHEHESEAFYVLEGAIDVEICGTRRRLEAGQSAFLPARVPHAWFVPGTGPAKALVVSTPGGIERMFEDVDWLAQRGVADPAALLPVLARHGVTLHEPEAPALADDEDVRTD